MDNFFPAQGSLQLESTGLRWVRRKLKEKSAVYAQRLVVFWNDLLEEVVETDTIRTFKMHLNRYFNRKSVEGYERNAGKWD